MNKYYDDWHATTLDTVILSCEKADNGYWITTEESNFYVKGGGMDSDKGTLNGFEVLDVRMTNDGHIAHLIQEPQTGNAHLEVDLYDREMRCEIHSAQHLVCGYINKKYHAKTIAFFNDDTEEGAEMGFTDLNEEILAEIENTCNAYIAEDLPLEILYPTREEAIRYAPEEKLEHDELRAVKIGDIDYNMCACVHVPSLRYLGMVKMTHFEKTTRGYKIFFVCGKQLNNLFERQNRLLRNLGKHFSTHPLEIDKSVTHLEEENRAHLSQIKHLEEEKCDHLAEKYLRDPRGIIAEEFVNLDNAVFSKLAAILTSGGKTVLFLSREDKGARFIFAKPKDAPADLTAILKKVKEITEVRGGGAPFRMQGSIPSCPDDVIALLKQFEN